MSPFVSNENTACPSECSRRRRRDYYLCFFLQQFQNLRVKESRYHTILLLDLNPKRSRDKKNNLRWEWINEYPTETLETLAQSAEIRPQVRVGRKEGCWCGCRVVVGVGGYYCLCVSLLFLLCVCVCDECCCCCCSLSLSLLSSRVSQ